MLNFTDIKYHALLHTIRKSQNLYSKSFYLISKSIIYIILKAERAGSNVLRFPLGQKHSMIRQTQYSYAIILYYVQFK